MFGAEGRYRERLATAQEEFARAQVEHGMRETQRQGRIVEARRRYAARLADEQRKVDEYNQSLDRFIAAVRDRDQDAVTHYLGMALDALRLPTHFPRKAEATYSPHGEQAVVQFELPGPDVVPATRAIQYVQTRDEHREIPRSAWCRFRRSASEGGAVVCRLVSATCAATEHRWSTAPGSRCSIGARGGGVVKA